MPAARYAWRPVFWLLIVVLLSPVASCSSPVDSTTAQQPAAQSPAAESPPGPAESPSVEVRTLTDEELAEGWISLFDGETLFGWRAESEANWRVEDGAIAVSSGEAGLLCTTSQFDHYVLKVDFRSTQGTNSGIFLRTPAKPTDPAKDCYELNIADAGISPFPTGSLVGRQKAEGNYDSDAWQSFEITVDGAHITVKLGGNQVLHYTDPHPLGRGFIGLQHNQGAVQFRNIKLKPLGLKSIFNGQDLTGWKTYPDMPSVFTVTEQGYLNVRNGRGQLESQQQYGDFVLQLECISHAQNLNSGIFFRCIPGEEMNGYECQIHNGYMDGDRTKPIDCGTGGIFRRQDARRVVADDFEWFHMTLIAGGPQMAAWVNGYQVSDWTDTRPPDPNPRKGLRLEAGTLMIQGHDPTTNLSFRNLRAREMTDPPVAQD